MCAVRLFAVAALIFAAIPIAGAQTVALGSDPVTAIDSGKPGSITLGPDGAVWLPWPAEKSAV